MRGQSVTRNQCPMLNSVVLPILQSLVPFCAAQRVRGTGACQWIASLTRSSSRTLAVHGFPGLKPELGSSTVDQVLKYTKYPKYIPSTSTGQVLIFLKKYLSTSSTFISSTSTSTSTHIKICSKVRMDIQSRVNFGWKK